MPEHPNRRTGYGSEFSWHRRITQTAEPRYTRGIRKEICHEMGRQLGLNAQHEKKTQIWPASRDSPKTGRETITTEKRAARNGSREWRRLIHPKQLQASHISFLR